MDSYGAAEVNAASFLTIRVWVDAPIQYGATVLGVDAPSLECTLDSTRVASLFAQHAAMNDRVAAGTWSLSQAEDLVMDALDHSNDALETIVPILLWLTSREEYSNAGPEMAEVIRHGGARLLVCCRHHPSDRPTIVFTLLLPTFQ